MPQSALYEGVLRHRRFKPVEHAFRYPLAMLYLDLDELPELFDSIPLWSARRPAPGRFDRGDHHGPPGEPLADSIRRLVRERTGRSVEGPVRLLTQPRTFGYSFNPVSFFYCFERPSGGRPKRVEAVVAEVENTPWGERHLYVLGSEREADGPARARRWRHGKEFHVSPFLGMDMDYDWRFTEPGERVVVHVSTERWLDRPFDATLVLRRRELSPGAMLGLLLRRPASGLQTLVRIYWQAARLWAKGAPRHPHPGRKNRSDVPPPRDGQNEVAP